MFSKRLRELRNEYGLSQTELGKKINLEAAAISKYENNVREPNLNVLKKLSEIFGVSIDYLLGKTDKKTTIVTDDTFVAIYEDYKELAEEDKEVINATIKALKKKNLK